VIKFAPEHRIDETIIEDIIPLENGNYLATMNLNNIQVGENAPAYMFLDKNLNLISWKYFNDDPDDIPEIWRDSPPRLFSIPNSTDILLLFRQTRSMQPFPFVTGNGYHSLYRMSQTGEIVWKQDYPDASRVVFANNLIVNSEGDIVLVGYGYPDIIPFCYQTLLERIDIANGNMLEKVFLPTSGDWHNGASITETGSNYAIQTYYSSNCEGILSGSPIIGAIIEMNSDFEFVNLQEVVSRSLQRNGSSSPAQLVQTTNGDFISAYRTGTSADTQEWGTVITRSTPSGDILWTWEDLVGNMEAFIGTSDGGIAVLMGRDTWRVMKLTENGDFK
jgi:hypothetical protein